MKFSFGIISKNIDKTFSIDFNQKPIINKTESKKKNIFISLLCGVFIGAINGFMGGGGGMICVPTLSIFLKLDTKSAHATTLFIMLPLCLTSFIVYLLSGVIDFSNILPVTLGFVVGGIIGAILLKNLKSNLIDIIFILVVLAAGIRLVI